MTTITVLKKESEYVGFHCIGHAGHKRFFFEKDMVCSAASVLVINTINAMEELAGESLKVVTNEETGFVKCDFEKPISEKGTLLLDSMIMGLQGIEKQYGKRYLQVKFEEV